MISKRLVEGVDERLDASSFIARNLKKVFPDHEYARIGVLR